jgi:hypothetical protein
MLALGTPALSEVCALLRAAALVLFAEGEPEAFFTMVATKVGNFD